MTLCGSNGSGQILVFQGAMYIIAYYSITGKRNEEKTMTKDYALMVLDKFWSSKGPCILLHIIP